MRQRERSKSKTAPRRQHGASGGGRRRNAAETREQILDAAEARLPAQGPDGLRLQEIAADVGISHPAILHHFGSRENLVRAVAERALGRLENELVSAMQTGAAADDLQAARALLDRVLATLGDRGHARLLAWLLLGGQDLGDTMRRHMAAIADAAHRVRVRRWRERGRGEPDPEDTLFSFTLAGFALLGEGLAGSTLSPATGSDARERFHGWLTQLLRDHLEGA